MARRRKRRTRAERAARKRRAAEQVTETTAPDLTQAQVNDLFAQLLADATTAKSAEDRIAAANDLTRLAEFCDRKHP